MGLTYSQAKALGLEEQWHQAFDSERRSVIIPHMRYRPISKAPSDGMNKLERAFWDRLNDARRLRKIDYVWREPFRLHLAGRTTYTPDFASWSSADDQELELLQIIVTCWEVKGFMRDDAAVKLKVAASMYPCFNFTLVTREKRQWICQTVDGDGIGKEWVWYPDWLR